MTTEEKEGLCLSWDKEIIPPKVGSEVNLCVFELDLFDRVSKSYRLT